MRVRYHPDDSRMANSYVALCIGHTYNMVGWAYENVFWICGILVTWKRIWINHNEIGSVRVAYLDIS